MEKVQSNTVISRQEMNRKIAKNIAHRITKFKYVMEEKEIELFVHKDFEEEVRRALTTEINRHATDCMIAFTMMNSGNRVNIKLVKERKKDNGPKAI